MGFGWIKLFLTPPALCLTSQNSLAIHGTSRIEWRFNKIISQAMAGLGQHGVAVLL